MAVDEDLNYKEGVEELTQEDEIYSESPLKKNYWKSTNGGTNRNKTKRSRPRKKGERKEQKDGEKYLVAQNNKTKKNPIITYEYVRSFSIRLIGNRNCFTAVMRLKYFKFRG